MNINTKTHKDYGVLESFSSSELSYTPIRHIGGSLNSLGCTTKTITFVLSFRNCVVETMFDKFPDGGLSMRYGYSGPFMFDEPFIINLISTMWSTCNSQQEMSVE